MTRIVGVKTVTVTTVDRRSRVKTIETFSTSLHATKGRRASHRNVRKEPLSSWGYVPSRVVKAKWSGS
jgi:hypothetical protein